MSRIAFNGAPVDTAGRLPAVGIRAPEFKLAAADLTDKSLADFAGKNKLLNIVPSLDTPVCALSAQKFSAEVAALPNTVLLNISADLPFAQKRFCDSHSLPNVIALSTLRAPAFGREYGVQIISGPLTGLMSRAVLVVNVDNRIVYREQVPDIAREPNYAAAIQALKKLIQP